MSLIGEGFNAPGAEVSRAAGLPIEPVIEVSGMALSAVARDSSVLCRRIT